MGAGLCLPAGVWLPELPPGEQDLSSPALAAHQDGAWALAASTGLVDTGMHVRLQVYAKGATTGMPWLQLSPPGLVANRMPSVASLQQGGWLVVWRAEDAQNQTVAYFGARVALDGQSLVGGVFPLNSTLLGYGESTGNGNVVAPVVLRLRDDALLAVWSGGAKGQGIQLGIYARRFDAKGQALGPEIDTGSVVPGQQAQSPGIAALTGGTAMVVWEIQPAGKKGDPFVQGRRINEAGQMLGAPVALSPQVLEYEALPAVTGFADGSLLATWKASQNKSATSPVDVRAQRHFPDQVPAFKGKAHTLAYDATGTYPYRASAATLPDGRAVVAWHNASSQPHVLELSRYYPSVDAFDCAPTDVSGVLLPDETGPRYIPDVVGFADGRILVAWHTAVANPNGVETLGRVALRFFPW